MIQVIKGDFVFAKTIKEFVIHQASYMVVKEGIIEGVYKALPAKYSHISIKEYKDQLIIPSFSDIHVHAPQHLNSGLGLDQQLLPWLNQYTFPLECRYSDEVFARESYKAFINELWKVGSLRAVVFATYHQAATKILCDLFEQSGLKAYVGKVNMDRNTMPLEPEITKTSIEETIHLIETLAKGYKNVKYIVTPRFVPVTTPELMTSLGDLVERYGLPVQSHLAENQDEVAWVKRLHPKSGSFTEVYAEYGLLPKGKTIMAHCIYLDSKERELLKMQDVLIAHCAQSNKNLASGMMPARKYIEEGLKIGIASDVGAGHVLHMNRHIVESIQVSKLNWVQKRDQKPLTVAEVFYMATHENGKFFGQTGSFEVGYTFDALVIDKQDKNASIETCLEQFLYLGDERQISERILEGVVINKPF